MINVRFKKVYYTQKVDETIGNAIRFDLVTDVIGLVSVSFHSTCLNGMIISAKTVRR